MNRAAPAANVSSDIRAACASQPHRAILGPFRVMCVLSWVLELVHAAGNDEVAVARTMPHES